MARRLRLYESLTASRSEISCGWPSAKPMRMPASAYDFDIVRRIRRLGCLPTSSSCDSGAKSTYASSRTTTPRDRASTRSTDILPWCVPVGEFGLTRNLSGAGSSTRSGVHVQPSAVGWVEGVTSCTRHKGSRSGYVGVEYATRSPASAKARKHISISSSPPFPSATWFVSSPKCSAIALRAGAAVGLGYRRNESPVAALMASMTFDEGGSGDSLVLSLTQSPPSGGCSPGTYGW